jgi:uncharacterized damage-inducible protein DinB
MSTQTMGEKEMFTATLEREFQTTTKLLRQWPAGREDFKPADRSRTARELSWIFIAEEKVLDAVLAGELTMTKAPPAPPLSVAELLTMFEGSHRELMAKLAAVDPARLDAKVKFPVGPGQLADLRVADVLWTMLMDAVHHRGQLSVYLRMVGAKVPSIYGPSADEPWD